MCFKETSSSSGYTDGCWTLNADFIPLRTEMEETIIIGKVYRLITYAEGWTKSIEGAAGTYTQRLKPSA
jgi:hypothetical protein